MQRASDGDPHVGLRSRTPALVSRPRRLFTDYKAPAAADLDGPTDVALWIIQRDERLGVHAYEACLRVIP